MTSLTKEQITFSYMPYQSGQLVLQVSKDSSADIVLCIEILYGDVGPMNEDCYFCL